MLASVTKLSFGTRPMPELLETALGYASHGFPAGYRYSSVFNLHLRSGAEWVAPMACWSIRQKSTTLICSHTATVSP